MSHFNTFSAFSVARLPEIRFGAGRIGEIPDVAAQFAKKVLLVTGGKSFISTPHWSALQSGLAQHGISWEWVQVTDEPSPELVDEATARYGGRRSGPNAGWGSTASARRRTSPFRSRATSAAPSTS